MTQRKLIGSHRNSGCFRRIPSDRCKNITNSAFSKFESYRAARKGLDCCGAARLAMTGKGGHCEPKVKQSSGGTQLIPFMELFHWF